MKKVKSFIQKVKSFIRKKTEKIKETEKFPISVGYLSCEEARYNRRFLYLILMLFLASIQEASARDPFVDGFTVKPSIQRSNRLDRGSQTITSQSIGSTPNPGSGSNPGSAGDSIPGFKGITPPELVYPISPTQKKPKKVEDQCEIEDEVDEFDEIALTRSGQIRIDENRRFILITRLDGREFIITRDQVRDKFHHAKLFPNIKIPDTFDMQYAQSLSYNDRRAYFRNVDVLPNETVEELMMEMGANVADQNSRPFKGTIGPYRIEGTLLINSTTRRVYFFDKRNNQFRTVVDQSVPQMQKLSENNFHLPFGEKKKK